MTIDALGRDRAFAGPRVVAFPIRSSQFAHERRLYER